MTPDSPALHDDELLRALAEQRDAGLRLGLSTSGPQQADVVRAALDVVVGGEPLFSVVQSTWNLLEPSAGAALAEAADAGWSVVVKEALANGRLTPSGSDEHGGAAVAAAEAGLPLDQLALAAALAQPWVSLVLSGAVTPEQVHSGVAAVEAALDEGALWRASSLAEDSAAYWQARSRRAWR